jgi:hypothetical protein
LIAYDETKSSSSSPPGISVPQDEVSNGPGVAHDATLTSLAQLGCFLLDCERSFISVLDNNAQYVIAEATRGASLKNPIHAGTDDTSPPGTRAIDLVWDVGLYALQAFTASDDTRNVSEEHVILNQNVHIMNDMALLDGLKGRPYIYGYPHLRFYAAVPIRSETGIIGIYCVVDNKKRQGLEQKGLEPLNNVASAIVQHLELLKKQYDLQRARGMVQGLGLFVEGKCGWGDQELVGQRRSNEKAPTRSPSRDAPGSNGHHVQKAASTRASPDSAKSAVTPALATARAMGAKQTSSNSSLGPRERKLSVDETAVKSLAPTGTMELFSRASNLIRQAIGLDGAMFIDGGFSSGVVDFLHPVSKAPSPESPPSKGAKRASTADHTDLCFSSSDLLGYSIREYFNLSGTKAASQQSTLPRTTLRSLLKDYWQGLIFFFNEDGSLSGVSRPGELLVNDTTETFREFQNETKREWVTEILDICPGARTVVFFPLWDPQRDRWSIGGLAWSNSPSGILQADDITYLTAFGRCIMTEKSRLDAITADRAKANFISSVSHELRSPLHGVLASAEALQETSTTYTQDDLIRTITVCGEVLLDTTDQM